MSADLSGAIPVLVGASVAFGLVVLVAPRMAARVERGAATCPDCGLSRRDADEPCPYCSEAHCPECLATVGRHDVVCGACGCEELEQIVWPDEPPMPPR